IVLFFSLSPSELRCSGPDWYEFGEFCYKPFGDRKTWGAAHEDCVARGANLVSIHSQEEEEFLSVYSKASSKWIDHSDILGYSWSDGTPLSHTNWGRGEPNDHDGREECVEMVSSTNGTYSWWNDLNCDAHQDWICMIAKGKNPILPPVPPPPVPGKTVIPPENAQRRRFVFLLF
uniref:C-type lectin domain-containing protein n=1 Tax=Scophthalmus maximus TaxID=52904 RepID=A0A8D3ECW2_SCOMX